MKRTHSLTLAETKKNIHFKSAALRKLMGESMHVSKRRQTKVGEFKAVKTQLQASRMRRMRALSESGINKDKKQRGKGENEFKAMLTIFASEIESQRQYAAQSEKKIRSLQHMHEEFKEEVLRYLRSLETRESAFTVIALMDKGANIVKDPLEKEEVDEDDEEEVLEEEVLMQGLVGMM